MVVINMSHRTSYYNISSGAIPVTFEGYGGISEAASIGRDNRW